MAILIFILYRNSIYSDVEPKGPQPTGSVASCEQHPAFTGLGGREPCLQALLPTFVVFCFLGKKCLSVVLYSL